MSMTYFMIITQCIYDSVFLYKENFHRKMRRKYVLEDSTRYLFSFGK